MKNALVLSPETPAQPATQPINQTAVIQTALSAMNDAHESSAWRDVADAIKTNREAKKLLREILWFAGTGHKDDARKAFGLGMSAGIAYAAQMK